MATTSWPEAELISGLEGCDAFWKSLPFTYLFVGHALYCTIPGKEFKDRWLLHLLLTFLWGNGGGIVTAALMMQPKVATFSFFQADLIVTAWVVCWWLVNWCPGGMPAKLLHVWWIKMFAKACTMLCRAQLIVSRVDLAVQLYPGMVVPPLILGTIAGCGGRLLADGIMTGWQSMPGLAELTSPGFVSRSAAFAAVAYYLLAYATQLLPVQAAAGLVVTGLMLHSFASDLTGLPLDFTEPVTQLLHTITRVPAPPPQPQPAHVTVALKSVTPAKKTPAKSPAQQSPAAAAAKKPANGAAAASPLASPARGRQAVQDTCDAGQDTGGAGGEAQQRGGQGKARRSVVADVGAAGPSGGVTTRRRAAAAAYA